MCCFLSTLLISSLSSLPTVSPVEKLMNQTTGTLPVWLRFGHDTVVVWSWYDHSRGTVAVRSRYGHGTAAVRLKYGRGLVAVRSWYDHGADMFMVRSRCTLPVRS